MSTFKLEDKEYKIEDMTNRAKGLTAHARDLETKILRQQMDLEQNITARNAYIAELKAELEKTKEEPQAAE
jgi:predicted  nucleic acid-binding Zn-ribbon protein|tara:strand:+ start:2151 stop:2363 length:213 start_codon:yes stop_codon:yes gene_type:complete